MPKKIITGVERVEEILQNSGIQRITSVGKKPNPTSFSTVQETECGLCNML